jgi:ankyrin repeat protein
LGTWVFRFWSKDDDLAKVKALLKGNPALVVSKDEANDNDFTPLHWAASNGYKEVG